MAVVHVWIGSGNIDPTVGTFLQNVDTRFPRLTEPKFPGLALQPGSSATLKLKIKMPAVIEKSNYFGNSFLMQVAYDDIGKYLDRSLFVFAIA